MLTRLLRRVIAYDGSWYYDPRSDRPGRLAHLKLQQNSHFKRNPAASAVTATHTNEPGPRGPARRTERIT